MSASQQFQAKGFYMSGCVSLVLAALKLAEMKSWSWWRVFLPFWVIVGQNVIYVLVGFLCLFAVRYGEDEEAEEPAKVQSDRIVYQVASLVCVLISTDNLLRWLERGGNSYWFWLCSGSVAMVVLFGILALVAQFFTLHRHFRELTAMSPLQYQKQLRLHSARERMLMDDIDAATAAFEVGYESASHFNREYNRLFGQPPKRDIQTLRSSAALPLEPLDTRQSAS